ncbi:MAG: Type 1 glutamine amidotransferase-like domain-containing protein [bacterium]|nr:Type 1 glutamine amidotransferase-like domain-containing protein [bacterium]
MKLFLASSLDKTLPLLLERMGKPALSLKVLFVANASDIFENTWWVDRDREAFREMGCQLIEIDLRQTSAQELVKYMTDASILHVCGGSVLYLMNLLHKKGFIDAIQKAVNEEKIVYTGTSAGSIVAASNVRLYSFDPEEMDVAKNIENFSGLGFVPFIIKPHVNNEEQHEKDFLEHASQQLLPILLLRDSQAVWVENKKFEIVSTE